MNLERNPHERPARLLRILTALVHGVCRVPHFVLFLALGLCGLSLYACATRLEYRTERSDLINPRKGYHQRYLKYVAEFGEDNDIVLVVQGTDRARMESALERLAERIGQQPEHFDRLFYKVDLRSLHNRALLFLSSEQIEQIRRNLDSMKLLLEFGPAGWRSLSLLGLLAEAQLRSVTLQPGEKLNEADTQLFTQLTSVCRAASATAADVSAYSNPWGSLMVQPAGQKDLLAEPQYFFSGDGTLAFLLARPKKEAGSFTGARASVDAMRTITATVRPEFPEVSLGLTGLPVLETDEMVAAQHDTELASWLAISGVTLLFFAVYRSIYYPLLTVGTLLIGTCLALGWMTMTVGHLNILSATFAVMLIGMGDYGVLWVMRYEQERRRGADVETALRDTCVCVGAGTLTAAMTTALAFYAAMLADFQGVAELGWIAGSGVLLCALSCFTVLPALLKLFDRRSEFQLVLLPLPAQSSWLPGLAGRSHWVVTGGILLTIVLAGFATRVGYDHNLLHLQAADLESVQWEQRLIEHTAGASWHAISYRSSPEAALALKAEYEKLPEVSRVVEIASLVPPDQEKKLAHLADIQHRLRALPELGKTIPHSRPDPLLLRKQLALLQQQLQPLGGMLPSPLLAELCQSLGSLQTRLEANSPDLGVRLQQFEERLTDDLVADLHRLRAVATPAPITLAELPPSLRERYVSPSGQWLVQAFGKDCLWDFEPLDHFIQRIQTVDPEATGKSFGTVEGLKAMKSGFEWAGIYAFGAIVLVLLKDFRNPRQTLIALAPLAMGITLALGIMGLFGVALNPANMIALPLVLGVGVDNGVHILHDYLAKKTEGRHRLSKAIGRGVLVKAMTTMIGFGTLMISSQRGLVGLGFCLTLGVACCMVTALLFLPALLQLLPHGADAAVSSKQTEAPVRRAA